MRTERETERPKAGRGGHCNGGRKGDKEGEKEKEKDARREEEVDEGEEKEKDTNQCSFVRQSAQTTLEIHRAEPVDECSA